MAKSKTLQELLVTKVKALYDIETELIKSLPKLGEAATNSDLKKAFEDHLEETKVQRDNLEQVFKLLDEEPEALEVEGIRGMAKDAEWIVDNTEEGNALDTALIAAARRVEHYEMAGYMSAEEWAKSLGHSEAASLLRKIYEQEEAADGKLATLSPLVAEGAKG